MLQVTTPRSEPGKLPTYGNKPDELRAAVESGCPEQAHAARPVAATMLLIDLVRAGPVVARSAGVAGAEEGGEATRHRGDHEDRPCLKGDIHYLAASGQGIRDRR